MPILMNLILGVGMVVLGNLFMPKPERPKPPTLEDFEEPTTSANRPIPAVFGTVVVTGPNFLWHGEKDMRRRDVDIDKSKGRS